MEFKVGDRITVKQYADIPKMHKSRAVGKLCGRSGKIINVLMDANGEALYIIHLDGYAAESKKLWSGDCLINEVTAQYSWTFEVLDNVVVGVMFETVGNRKTEITRGHGHLIHEGSVGIAQAASYALKKAFENLKSTNKEARI